MSIVAKMSGDNKTLTEQRGITLTLPLKKGRTGRLPKRLLTPFERVQDFQRGLYLKAKRKEVKRFYSLYDKVYSKGTYCLSRGNEFGQIKVVQE